MLCSQLFLCRAENILENNALAYKVSVVIFTLLNIYLNAKRNECGQTIEKFSQIPLLLVFPPQVAEDSLGIPSLLDPEVLTILIFENPWPWCCLIF